MFDKHKCASFTVLHIIHAYIQSVFIHRRSKKKYDKDGNVEPSATDASGEVIREVSDVDVDDADDDDDDDDDGSDSGYDESDDDEEIAKPVP